MRRIIKHSITNDFRPNLSYIFDNFWFNHHLFVCRNSNFKNICKIKYTVSAINELIAWNSSKSFNIFIYEFYFFFRINHSHFLRLDNKIRSINISSWEIISHEKSLWSIRTKKIIKSCEYFIWICRKI